MTCSLLGHWIIELDFVIKCKYCILANIRWPVLQRWHRLDGVVLDGVAFICILIEVTTITICSNYVFNIYWFSTLFTDSIWCGVRFKPATIHLLTTKLAVLTTSVQLDVPKSLNNISNKETCLINHDAFLNWDWKLHNKNWLNNSNQ